MTLAYSGLRVRTAATPRQQTALTCTTSAYSSRVEPQIRYTRTSDGHSIAFWALGKGTTFIALPPTYGHAIEREWQIPAVRNRAETSARFLRYVRYDPRGVGLSDAVVDDFSMEALLLDLEAIVAEVSPDEPVVISGPGKFGMLAIAFAARFPERVSKLVLWSSAATGAELTSAPLDRLLELAAIDWDLAMESLTQAIDDFEDANLARQMASMSREMSAASRVSFVAFEQEVADWDVTALLADVRCPTLVMHPRRSRYLPIENARRLAAGIEHSQLRLVDTASALANHPDVFRFAGEFLFENQSAMPGAASASRPVLVVLFVDIVDSTGMTERIGDVKFHDRAKALDRQLRDAIEQAHGRTIDGKTLGDGVLATFVSAHQAIVAAQRCAAAGSAADLPLHLGIHAGDVIRDDDNVFGGAVNIAARVSAMSQPGEVLVTSTVRDLGRTAATANFVDRGTHDLKGIEEPVHVYAVTTRTD